ncbi:NHL repeat-containing protein [Nocardioides bruguierae]|uniref:NHL repeat-containing protein n=1 Tax=Nocardioides bruguierae TaxID=2945102 RepID=UPI00202244B2|nr:NHL repeat-containing protein [Nocardioides bruguierae]MCL8025405.1 NHL repeat-containing protein [Nocardioides bruguierae]
MKVQVMATGSLHAGHQPGLGVTGEAPSTYDGWAPRVVLGADSPGGLALPPASPTAAWLYGPRAVWTDGAMVVAADTGNHRVLIWHTLPTADGTPADVVLGQPDETSEGPAAGGAGAAHGMYLPTGVLVHEGRLVVADAWHHRLLVWDAVPTATATPPDHVIGQASFDEVEPNAGREADAGTFYWPFGIAVVDGRFHVADTGNRRVLIWRDGLPLDGRPADVVLGQPDEHAREENRGGEVGPASFRWPHALAGTGTGGLLVADAGNHRVLRWDAHPEADAPADAALGQPDLVSGTEFPYVSQAGRMRFPYGLATVTGDSPGTAVADTANNRVLLFAGTDAVGDALPTAVLGQRTHAANGENRWEMVAADTFCWPYGLHWHRPEPGTDRPELVAVADSGNNRVVIWARP